jgi:hypothetical protein
MTDPARPDRLPVLALVLPACFVVEVILGGPFGIYGGVSVRFLLLGASCAVLLLAVLLRGRIEGSQAAPILSIVGFLAVNGLWIAVVPVIASTNMHWSLREAHAFIVMVLAVLILALLRRDQLARVLPGLQRLVVVTSVVLAVMQVGIWVLGTLLGGMEWVVQLVLNTIYANAGDHLKVGLSPDGFYRVFWISTLWCVLSFFWTPVAFPGSLLRWPIRALLLMDLFVAYSRGIWVGLLLGQAVVLFTVLTRRNFGRVLVRATVIGAVVTAALVGVLAATGSLERGVARFTSTGSREDQSISERIAQAPYLLRLWYEHPVVGNGYGAYSHALVRSQEAPYSYEHMPYALLAKLGLLGVLGMGLFLAGWAGTAWRARRRAPLQAGAFLGGGVALLVADMTNPLVLDFVSMSIFACLLVQWTYVASLPPAGPPASTG